MRFLFVDRILQLIPGSIIRGIKHITTDDHYLCKNEQGQYYFASSLIGGTLGQLVAWNVMATNHFSHRPVAGVVASACLYRQAYLGETLLLESFIDSLDDYAVQYHSTAYIGKDVVFTIQGALGPLLPMERFIHTDDVRRQFAEIHRPGDWPDQIHTPCEKVAAPPFTLQPFLITFDQVIECKPGVSMIAIKKISRSAPYFADHFPYNPVLPLTILLECKINLAGLFLKYANLDSIYYVSELRKIKMSEFVYPGDILYCHVTVQQHDQQQIILRFRSEVENKRVCILDMVMTAKGN